jgi:hypothetical protein
VIQSVNQTRPPPGPAQPLHFLQFLLPLLPRFWIFAVAPATGQLPLPAYGVPGCAVRIPPMSLPLAWRFLKLTFLRRPLPRCRIKRWAWSRSTSLRRHIRLLAATAVCSPPQPSARRHSRLLSATAVCSPPQPSARRHSRLLAATAFCSPEKIPAPESYPRCLRAPRRLALDALPPQTSRRAGRRNLVTRLTYHLRTRA